MKKDGIEREYILKAIEGWMFIYEKCLRFYTDP